MKELKMKDLVLEHYRKVYETEMDGVTVRVHKPKTMGKLPTYAMLNVLRHRATDANRWAAIERDCKVQWWLGNPDVGAWDAQIVRRFDPRTMTLDIYFASLLIRPFSKQAFDWYDNHQLVNDPVARLTMMWDSRDFDREGGFDTSYGAYSNQEELDKVMYSGEEVAGYECMTDPAFDPMYEQSKTPQPGMVIKYRHKDGNIESETSWPKMSKEYVDKMQDYLKPTLETYLNFNEDHPEVKEMHFYTEYTVWEKDLEEEE